MAKISEIIDFEHDHMVIKKKHDVSQLPVLKEGAVIGILTESKALGTLVERPGAGKETVGSLTEISYSVVDGVTGVSVLSDMFTKVKMVLVMEGTEIINVITKIDLIDYMAKAAN